MARSSDISKAVRSAASSLGYSILRPEQEAAITKFVSGQDVFVCLPTGFGKSLCYTALPLVCDILCGHRESYSTIIIVSPLVAIIEDQIQSIRRKGLKAVHACMSIRIVVQK